jgi:hypothetical protein
MLRRYRYSSRKRKEIQSHKKTFVKAVATKKMPAFAYYSIRVITISPSRLAQLFENERRYIFEFSVYGYSIN